MNRIKSLDGIRGFFIILVILAHALETTSYNNYNKMLVYFITTTAFTGVKIFFVMSGYLITKLLMLEREKTGKINIREFYIRRALRIFPIFFIYILTLMILKWTILPDIFTDYTLILFASLYLWNYKHLMMTVPESDNGIFYLSHFWSLSIEEQFYLLWPVAFIKTHKQKLINAVIIIMAVMPFIRVATYFLMPGSRPEVSVMLHTSGDTILIGCLGALMEKSDFFIKHIKHRLHDKLTILLLACFLFIFSPLLTYYFEGKYLMTIGQTLNNIAIILLLFWAMLVPSKVSSVLNTKVLVKLGILSYSLYVWQPIFLSNRTHFWINKFPQNVFMVILVGFISFYIIEKPILKLKKKYKQV